PLALRAERRRRPDRARSVERRDARLSPHDGAAPARRPRRRRLQGRLHRAHSGGAWGIALLHELLATLYAAAKAAKPDALVVTHTPHPAFADVTDMIRLNDVFGGIDVVAQMTFRADVVRAAVPELPIDTDDWPMPDKRSWRE